MNAKDFNKNWELMGFEIKLYRGASYCGGVLWFAPSDRAAKAYAKKYIAAEMAAYPAITGARVRNVDRHVTLLDL